ncbi:MAG: hypothetical protein ACK4MX_12100 [Thermaurantiacus sp.]
MDLFAHDAACRARAAANAQFDAIWNSPEGRARRRRVSRDLARGLVEEARGCRLLGWRRDAVWWLARVGMERRGAGR